jgi:two-component system, OmpR family, KDP operon response regulator KdpE
MTVQNILVVDDENSIRHALRLTLAALGCGVSEAATGEEALVLIDRVHYDAVLLDINMPGMGGMNACREIRLKAPDVPILMLTVRDAPDDKVEALDTGADDYVTKPFHVGELVARMRAAVRRAKVMPPQPEDKSLCIGEIRLDPDRRTVYKTGIRIHVTPKEFELLHVLMLHSGKPVAHNHLLSSVWGAEYVGQMEYLRTFVHQLRRKLEDDPARPEYIVTDSWFGYRFRS